MAQKGLIQQLMRYLTYSSTATMTFRLRLREVVGEDTATSTSTPGTLGLSAWEVELVTDTNFALITLIDPFANA